MKKLKRQIIIRQYDYDKMISRALPSLYHRAEFTPITLTELEQEHLMKVLSDDNPQYRNQRPKGKPRWKDSRDEEYYQYPRNFLWYMQDYLYDKNYVDWFSDYDEDGYMWIQARKNTPRTLLGWGTFEYTY